MSISPPSDIILDVTRAADPARVREAAARLNAPPATDGKFEATLAAEKVAPPPAVHPNLPGAGAAPAPPGAGRGVADAPTAYRDFEAMVLANFFESAMPHDDVLFGAGTSGSVWKSVFVQEIAKSVAAKGGIGIADALARDGALAPHALGAQTANPDLTRLLLARLADHSADTLWSTE